MSNYDGDDEGPKTIPTEIEKNNLDSGDITIISCCFGIIFIVIIALITVLVQ
ncbi:hypothetical protein [Methanobrevibacter boviskoreani]|uniref:hypothetical protein n=1 Tax=Methanobrevibacter boviskoreani TaxID=1348249 RepID=UPI0023F4213C|nr:hypothetical protein [Methanobrevibacter boviskoreani]MDD6257108.1 hypothetical protein [Methanobrevibacter boviskoreani]